MEPLKTPWIRIDHFMEPLKTPSIRIDPSWSLSKLHGSE
jgi:hypothetical protein